MDEYPYTLFDETSTVEQKRDAANRIEVILDYIITAKEIMEAMKKYHDYHNKSACFKMYTIFEDNDRFIALILAINNGVPLRDIMMTASLIDDNYLLDTCGDTFENMIINLIKKLLNYHEYSIDDLPISESYKKILREHIKSRHTLTKPAR